MKNNVASKAKLLRSVAHAAEYARGGNGTTGNPYYGFEPRLPLAAGMAIAFDDPERAERPVFLFEDGLDIGDYPRLRLYSRSRAVFRWAGAPGGTVVNSRGQLTGSTPLCWGQEIEGIEIDGGGRPGSRANAAGIGIRFRFSHGIIMRNVVIHGLAAADSIGLYLDGWTVGALFDSVFINHAMANGLYEATGVTAERGIVIEAIDPLDPEYGPTWVPTLQTWINCQAASCDDAGLDIKSVSSPAATVQELRFIGGALAGNGGPGARVNAGSKLITLVGVNLENNGRIAQSVTAEPLRTAVSIAGGRQVKILDCCSNQVVTIDATSTECDVIGGQHATAVDDGDASTLEALWTVAAPTGNGTRRRYRHHSPAGNAARWIYSTYNNDADAVLLRVENRHTGIAALARLQIASRNGLDGTYEITQAAADGNYGVTGLQAGDAIHWLPSGKTVVVMDSAFALRDVLCGGIESRGALTVTTGGASITGTTAITGAATVSSTLGVTGATTLSSTLGVTGLGTFSGGITVSSGNVGIGATPLSLLEVSGGVGVAKFTIANSDGFTGARRFSLLNTFDGTSNYLNFQVDNNAGTKVTDVLTLRTGGFVGVGTTSPASKLDVFNGVVTQSANSSTSTKRSQYDETCSWIDSTDATRKARVTFSVYDTAAREFMRADATGGGTNKTLVQFTGTIGVNTSNQSSFLVIKGDDALGNYRILDNANVIRWRNDQGYSYICRNAAGTDVGTWRSDNGNFGIGTVDQFGSGTGVFGLHNATAVPSTNPTAGGVLYAEGGALKWRGSSGTITTIAPA